MQFIFLFFSFTLYTLWLSFPSLHLLLLTPFISSSFCPSSYPTPPLLSLGHAHRSNRSSSRSPGGVEQSRRSTLLSGFQSTTCEPMFVWSERSIYCMLSGIAVIPWWEKHVNCVNMWGSGFHSLAQFNLDEFQREASPCVPQTLHFELNLREPKCPQAPVRTHT